MDTALQIKLPLPLDLVNGLMQTMLVIWPDAKLKQDANYLTFLLPDLDSSSREFAAKLTELESKKGEIQEYLANETPAIMLEFSLDSTGADLKLNTAEEFSKAFLAAVKNMLNEGEYIAENYVEMEMYDSETNEKYVVIACRSSKQTPHQLRKKAEERANIYADKLRALGVDPESLL